MKNFGCYIFYNEINMMYNILKLFHNLNLFVTFMTWSTQRAKSIQFFHTFRFWNRKN